MNCYHIPLLSRARTDVSKPPKPYTPNLTCMVPCMVTVLITASISAVFDQYMYFPAVLSVSRLLCLLGSPGSIVPVSGSLVIESTQTSTGRRPSSVKILHIFHDIITLKALTVAKFDRKNPKSYLHRWGTFGVHCTAPSFVFGSEH